MIGFLLLLLSAMAPPAPVTGDFDRDGRRDVARLRADRVGVTIEIESRGRRHRIDRQSFSEPYLGINRFRGRVKTVCGKGYDVDCGPGAPNTVRLRGGELVYGQRESSDFVVLWIGGRFRAVQLSD